MIVGFGFVNSEEGIKMVSLEKSGKLRFEAIDSQDAAACGLPLPQSQQTVAQLGSDQQASARPITGRPVSQAASSRWRPGSTQPCSTKRSS
jgi:hypothetical protein